MGLHEIVIIIKHLVCYKEFYIRKGFLFIIIWDTNNPFCVPKNPHNTHIFTVAGIPILIS